MVFPFNRPKESTGNNSSKTTIEEQILRLSSDHPSVRERKAETVGLVRFDSFEIGWGRGGFWREKNVDIV